MGMTGIDK